MRELTIPRLRALLATALVLTTLSACGSSDHTSAAASCLKNALANQALGGGNNCADSTAAGIEQRLQAINVTCTHRQANEYICDVTGQSTLPAPVNDIQTGFYDVVYDGHSITYQPTQ